MATLGKQASGLYNVRLQVWRIDFPYMTEIYLYFGPKSGAEKSAMTIKKRTKWPYSPRIKQIIQ